MKTTWKQFSFLAALLISISQSGCNAQSLLNPGEVQNFSLQLARQDSPDAVTKSHDTSADQTRGSVAQVQFEYPSARCAYLYSPTDFCDTIHINAYRDALESKPINFANGLILLDIPTRPDYFQKSLVVIEPDTGIVWPFPFDAYSGPIDEDGNSIGDGNLEYSLDSSRVCIEGTLLVYRVLEAGRFCFTFNGGRFEGHSTAYTQPEFVANAPPVPGHCDSGGNCTLALTNNPDALGLCEGNAPRLYWNQGRENYLFACECDCSSHDNTGWLVDVSTGRVQGVKLGKPAVAQELINVDVVTDIMASHPFCEALDSNSLQSAEFVSLIKYPTGNDNIPYCFSPRTFIKSGESIVIKDNGSRVFEDDDEVFLSTSEDVAAKVLTLTRQQAR